MESIVLTIHLILALLLIGVVLLQKSEGAALLAGGGNTQARPKATAITKLTWAFAAAFIVTSIALTVLATRGPGGSVVDKLMPPSVNENSETTPGASLLPPPVSSVSDAPAAPPRMDEPAAPPAPVTEAPAPAEANTEAAPEAPEAQEPAAAGTSGN